METAHRVSAIISKTGTLTQGSWSRTALIAAADQIRFCQVLRAAEADSGTRPRILSYATKTLETDGAPLRPRRTLWPCPARLQCHVESVGAVYIGNRAMSEAASIRCPTTWSAGALEDGKTACWSPEGVGLAGCGGCRA